MVAKDDGTTKIGITGAKAREKRVSRHRRNGYEMVSTWNVAVGSDARAIEKAVVFGWREAGFRPAAPEGEDGWTESVHTSQVSIPEIRAQVNELVVGLSSQ